MNHRVKAAPVLVAALALTVLGCSAPRSTETVSTADGGDVRAPSLVASPGSSPSAVATSATPRSSSEAASRVESRTFRSASLGVDKTYWVYLPRGYDGSAARFPTVYMLHGLGGNEKNWLDHGALKEAADALSLRAIVVMPDGDASFYVDGPPGDSYEACLAKKPEPNPGESPATFCVRTPRYESYMTGDLIRDVDGRYRTIPKREARGVGGLSMGGFGAMMLAMRHQDLYSAVASHSGLVSLTYVGPHPWTKGKTMLAGSVSEWGAGYPTALSDLVKRIFGPKIESYRGFDPSLLAAKLAPGALAIYFDCGAQDDFHFEDQASYLDEVLEAHGVEHTFELAPGHHIFDFWKTRLPKSLAFFDAKLAHQ